MPHMHYDTEFADAIGGAIATIYPIATITTSAKAQDIRAFLINHANSGVRTTAEANIGEVIINPGDLGDGLIKIQMPTADGGAPATQIQEYWENAKWIPYKSHTGKTAKKKPIVFQYEQAPPDPTAIFCAQTSVAYTEETPAPEDVFDNVGSLRTRLKWADCTTLPDLGAALVDEFPDTITVPGWVKEIVAIGITVTLDVVGATAEHLTGYVEITGTIPGLSPMQIPMPAMHAPLAGTVVGRGGICYEQILPMFIQHDSPNQAELTFTATIQQVLTAVTAQVEVCLYGR